MARWRRDVTGALHLLRSNRDYRVLWISGALSGFGDFVFETTLLIWIATDLASGKSWAPTVTSALIAASAIPILVVGPFAGVFADRWNPRTIRLAATAVSASLIFALAATATDGAKMSPGVHITCILGVVALASATAQFLGPAASVMLREIVTLDELPIAAGASQAVSNLNLLIAPALAAVLFSTFGPFVGLVINALSFVLATVLVATVRDRPIWRSRTELPSSTGYWTDFREGIGQFRRFAVLRVIATSMTVVMVGAGMLNGLDIFFFLENLGASESQYGLIYSAQGAGMLAGSVLATQIVARRPVHELLWPALTGLGVMLLIYSRLSSVTPALIAIALLGICVSMLTVTLGPMVMTTIPREFIGRVTSLLGPMLGLGNLADLAIGGVSYSLLIGTFNLQVASMRFRPLDSIFALAAILTIATGIWVRFALERVLHSPAPIPARPGTGPIPVKGD
jgi:MFS family permease